MYINDVWPKWKNLLPHHSAIQLLCFALHTKTHTMKIEGKAAIVIGGARGIGKGCVDLLLERGAKVKWGFKMLSDVVGSMEVHNCLYIKKDVVTFWLNPKCAP